MDTQTIISQLSNAVVALIIIVLGAIGTFAVAWFKLLPERMKAQMAEYQANQEVQRQQAKDQSAIALEKARTENVVDETILSVTKDLAEGVLSSVTELRKMNEVQATNGGQLTTLKSDIANISKTLETGSQPLLDIGVQVKRILKIVEDIQNSPHLTEDKAKRLDDAVAQIGAVTQQLGELVVALQETQADLLRKKSDSQQIRTFTPEQPNGKEQ